MKERPDVIKGTTKRKKTPCGNMYITINTGDDGGILEILASLGKTGSCARSFLEALSRVTSLAIRQGVSEDDIAKTLLGIRCADSNGAFEHSCPHTLANAIKTVIEENNQKQEINK